MKNQMLIVKGPGNTGKSTVVKAAFERLLMSILKRQKPTTAKFLYLGTREVAAVVQVGRTKIGVSTRGDNKIEVERALSFFAENKCRLIVCTTRSKGAPYKYALDFSVNILKVQPDELTKYSERNPSKRTSTDIAFSKVIQQWATKAINVA